MWVRAADELAHIDASMDIMKDMRSTHELRPDFPLVVITALDRPAQVSFRKSGGGGETRGEEEEREEVMKCFMI